MIMEKYGYARCSTNESKQDIDRQRRELVELGIKKENIFWEYESGTKEVSPLHFFRTYFFLRTVRKRSMNK